MRKLLFVYCQRCGLIANDKTQNPKCKACEVAMQPVPSEFLTPSGFMFSSKEKRKEFEEFIKSGELFDETASENKEFIIRQKDSIQSEEIAKKVKEYQNTKVKVTCPVCHSETLTKISNMGKFVKVSALGILGAGDIGKKYKCNSCGYRF